MTKPRTPDICLSRAPRPAAPGRPATKASGFAKVLHYFFFHEHVNLLFRTHNCQMAADFKRTKFEFKVHYGQWSRNVQLSFLNTRWDSGMKHSYLLFKMPQLIMLDVNDRVSNYTNIYIKSNILACKNAIKSRRRLYITYC